MYERLGITPGVYTLNGCSKFNKKRLVLAGYKNREENRKRRKVLRGQTKSKEDKDVEIEGTLYESGAF